MRTLEELFERDIMRFLDERMSSKVDRRKLPRVEEENIFDLQRDFAKDVDAALAKDDLNRAKKIFDDLKVTYGKLKYSDMEKARIFRIMDGIHLKIKTYLIDKQKEKNIYQDLNDFEDRSSGSQPEQQLAGVKVQQLIDGVQALIANNDLAAAKEQAKMLVQAYNNLDASQRTPQMYELIKNVLVRLS